MSPENINTEIRSPRLRVGHKADDFALLFRKKKKGEIREVQTG
jgi:hypothetical protein